MSAGPENNGLVQSDYLVCGSEFVDFIATLLTNRIVERMSKAGALDKDTFGDVVDFLARMLAQQKADLSAVPDVDDDLWNRLLRCDSKLLVDLGLAVSTNKEEKKTAKATGRKAPQAAASGEVHAPRKPGRPRVRPIIFGSPRPRGRPRKVIS